MNKKRVGVITHYYANNFGAVLQCKALIDAISELFPEAICVALDFNSELRASAPTLTKVFAQKRGNGVKGILKGVGHCLILLLTRACAKKKSPTQNFINEEIKLDQQVHRNVNGLLEWDTETTPYDVLVCGSDQIWASWCLSPHFLLDTKPATPVAKIAYAPSFGNTDTLHSNQLSLLAEKLSHYIAISCRERDGSELIRRITGRECPIMPDPTMLHDREYWLNIAQKPEDFRYREKQYVFTYRISFMPHAAKMASYAAKQLNLPLVTCELVEPHAFYSKMGPREFLWCIANAAHVVTPSFHGTVFSIIMGTPFHAVCSKAPQERMKTLLHHMGLESRYVNATEQINTSAQLPAENILLTKITALRLHGTQWLHEQLRCALYPNN